MTVFFFDLPLPHSVLTKMFYMNNRIALLVLMPLFHEVRGSCLSQIGLPAFVRMAFLDDRSRIVLNPNPRCRPNLLRLRFLQSPQLNWRLSLFTPGDAMTTFYFSPLLEV